MFSLRKDGIQSGGRRSSEGGIKTLFENDASSARPEGSVDVCRMYWWQHDAKTPEISSGKDPERL